MWRSRAKEILFLNRSDDISVPVLGSTVEPLIKDPLRKGLYVRPLYKGHYHESQNITVHQEEDNLSTRDKTAQSILPPKCHFFRGFTIDERGAGSPQSSWT